jgi:6-phosphogluconolactonase (cycloisomerase 2 family)
MKLRALMYLVAALAGACGTDGAAGDVTAHESALHAARGGGAVFTISNELEGNRVLAFARGRDGSLGEQVAYPTGGKGTGDSLGSQGALVLTDDHRFLIAVDAGSNEISSFAVSGAALELRDRVSSGGVRPVSVTAREGLVYVVHAGGTNDVVGFAMDRRGHLHALPGAQHALSAESVGPGQVELSPDARELVVTEKMTNKIDVFRVGAFGRLDRAVFSDAAGQTPFGFEFTKRGDIVVSEAATTSTSSYAIGKRGARLITGPVSDTQMAPCWVAIGRDDRHAYVANAGSASVSSYAIARNGEITLEDARAGELGEGGRPLDMALSANGRTLYVLDRGNASVASFDVARDGSLEPAYASGELTPFASGLAAY